MHLTGQTCQKSAFQMVNFLYLEGTELGSTVEMNVCSDGPEAHSGVSISGSYEQFAYTHPIQMSKTLFGIYEPKSAWALTVCLTMREDIPVGWT